MNHNLTSIIKKHKPTFHPIIKIDKEIDSIIPFDFTAANNEITKDLIADTTKFSTYINNKLQQANASFGIGVTTKIALFIAAAISLQASKHAQALTASERATMASNALSAWTMS